MANVKIVCTPQEGRLILAALEEMDNSYTRAYITTHGVGERLPDDVMATKMAFARLSHNVVNAVSEAVTR